ncbi:polymorphic toxin-type HINT domain-containing protein [Tuwongella immobilis]|uniref:Hint domain-containing protein n=1 Tax=Tuwongella immobilis TaxID=692036 RepID=A0A6C2YQY6_9BACT|nr:polymorphic toxin-type HINT domain-containing protein [Tuwongella immobilis]VIP03767.1 yd repeat-containing protein : YD repeat protein OS=Isosphaera pallida (strain ATCC 43644 / DSM 9630 / IS1B) GN=Isop_2419 PE=4 SV=1: PT-HINT [Tuwongella immobilis]VTS04902.1 yd repeat-containing protein : YD repeat protein OS=Isosphaera pallida (strain ATCC 43644 / DSM 9630 / IS1B) GN=Isop_2419 PE=4 SV=1: PT-HINT [Tuwongella immobilis]
MTPDNGGAGSGSGSASGSGSGSSGTSGEIGYYPIGLPLIIGQTPDDNGTSAIQSRLEELAEERRRSLLGRWFGLRNPSSPESQEEVNLRNLLDLSKESNDWRYNPATKQFDAIITTNLPKIPAEYAGVLSEIERRLQNTAAGYDQYDDTAKNLIVQYRRVLEQIKLDQAQKLDELKASKKLSEDADFKAAMRKAAIQYQSDLRIRFEEMIAGLPQAQQVELRNRFSFLSANLDNPNDPAFKYFRLSMTIDASGEGVFAFRPTALLVQIQMMQGYYLGGLYYTTDNDPNNGTLYPSDKMTLPLTGLESLMMLYQYGTQDATIEWKSHWNRDTGIFARHKHMPIGLQPTGDELLIASFGTAGIAKSIMGGTLRQVFKASTFDLLTNLAFQQLDEKLQKAGVPPEMTPWVSLGLAIVTGKAVQRLQKPKASEPHAVGPVEAPKVPPTQPPRYSLQMVGPSCFVAGTPLLIPGGSKAIEQFVPGDAILSRDETDINGPINVQIVEAVFERSAIIFELRVAGQLIETTTEHPFWVVGRGWTPVWELTNGDALTTMSGESVSVEGVHETDRRQTVYNLRVSDYHTYFVGCDEWGFSVWVHNTCFEVRWDASLRRYALYDTTTNARVTYPTGHALAGKPIAGTDAAMVEALATNQGLRNINIAPRVAPEGVVLTERPYSPTDVRIESQVPSRQGQLAVTHRYTNPGHHDPSGRGLVHRYDPSRAQLPPNHVELFEQAIPVSDGSGSVVYWAIETTPSGRVYHRFQPDSTGTVYHWSGSTDGVTASGRRRVIDVGDVPGSVRNRK